MGSRSLCFLCCSQLEKVVRQREYRSSTPTVQDEGFLLELTCQRLKWSLFFHNAFYSYFHYWVYICKLILDLEINTTLPLGMFSAELVTFS